MVEDKLDLSVPIVVDLDGTLIYSDLLHEAILFLIKRKPWLLFHIVFLCLFNKTKLKSFIAKSVEFPVSCLPYNAELISYIVEQKKIGRKVILCTGSHVIFANAIANYLKIFDEVLGTNEFVNLIGVSKVKLLHSKFGDKQFDYVGNSYVDFSVWESSRKALIVSSNPYFIELVRQHYSVDKIFSRRANSLYDWSNVLRLHQWIKNVLIFVPAFAAHVEIDIFISSKLILSFISFSLAASFVYIFNDLIDLESDRFHARKCHRPFASGQIPIWIGMLLALIMIFCSLWVAKNVGINFLYWLFAYLFLSTLYSLILKRIVIVDVLVLAILYSLRIVAGAAAIELSPSFWILAFSIFLFLSLAFIKRVAELQSHDGEEKKLYGRGYITSDALLIQQLGISSGYAAVLVLALYINSENIVRLYSTPEMIWGAVPLLLWWLSWMWFQANRGLMHDDPIVFAVKDRISLFIGTLFLGAFALAH